MTTTRRKMLATSVATAGMIAAPHVARAQAPTTIELWTFLDPNARGVRSELLKEIFTSFEQANPGASVKANIIQWTEISPQLLRAARAGNVPDVVMLYSPFMASHVQAGTLAPLDDLMGAWSPQRREDTIVLPMARDRAGKIFYPNPPQA